MSILKSMTKIITHQQGSVYLPCFLPFYFIFLLLKLLFGLKEMQIWLQIWKYKQTNLCKWMSTINTTSKKKLIIAIFIELLSSKEHHITNETSFTTPGRYLPIHSAKIKIQRLDDTYQSWSKSCYSFDCTIMLRQSFCRVQESVKKRLCHTRLKIVIHMPKSVKFRLRT